MRTLALNAVRRCQLRSTHQKDPMPATPTRDRVSPETEHRPLRRPEWIKVRAPSGETYEQVLSVDAFERIAHRV